MKILNTTLAATVLSLSVVLIPSLVSADALYRQLQVGSRGADVSSLQSFLSSDASIYPSGMVTGYFGSLTKSGVIRFQARNGISQVGRVGPQTLAVINSQMGGTVSTGNLIESAPAFTTNVALTESNSIVTFNVNTDVMTRASIFYSTSPISGTENDGVRPVTVSLSGTGVQTNTNLQTNHNIASMPIQPNTVYYAMAVVTDINGVASVYKLPSFRTNN